MLHLIAYLLATRHLSSLEIWLLDSKMLPRSECSTPVGLLASSSVQAELMCVADYMMPPEALIVELMTDGETEPALIDFVFKTHKEVGLHPIVALKPSSGFIMNRIWAAIKRETLAVLAEGVSTAPEIDRVFKELYGARDGPCHMMDLVCYIHSTPQRSQ